MIDPKRVDRQVKAWYTMGRVAPFGALFVLCLALFFDLHTYLEYLLAGVAVIFAIFAFAWCRWVYLCTGPPLGCRWFTMRPTM